MDCSLPGSSVHGIFQAMVLEWIAISFSRGSSRPRNRTRVSHIVDRRFTVWTKSLSIKTFGSFSVAFFGSEALFLLFLFHYQKYRTHWVVPSLLLEGEAVCLDKPYSSFVMFCFWGLVTSLGQYLVNGHRSLVLLDPIKLLGTKGKGVGPALNTLCFSTVM